MLAKLEKMQRAQTLSLSKTSLVIKHGEVLRSIFCLSITLIWNFEVQFFQTVQIFQIPKTGVT